MYIIFRDKVSLFISSRSVAVLFLKASTALRISAITKRAFGDGAFLMSHRKETGWINDASGRLGGAY